METSYDQNWPWRLGVHRWIFLQSHQQGVNKGHHTRLASSAFLSWTIQIADLVSAIVVGGSLGPSSLCGSSRNRGTILRPGLVALVTLHSSSKVDTIAL